MAKGCFPKCSAVTEVHEGGWSNHAADPGGATMYGITIGKFREHYPKATAKDLRNITKENAREIYRQDFWLPINGETLAAGVDLAVYDAGVNSGVSRAKKWLTASVGGMPAETVKRICAKRLGFMQSLKIWKTFGRGWARRVADIEAKGVAWAMEASIPGLPQSRKAALKAEATKASGKATTQAAVGATSGGTGLVSAGIDQGSTAAAAPSTVLLVVLGALVMVGVILLLRSKIHGARSDAYNAEAAKL